MKRVRLKSVILTPVRCKGMFGLTSRQTEILRYIGLGMARKSIGPHLKLSVKTVEYHVAEIQRRLNLNSDTELTRFASEHGLVKPGEIMPQPNEKVTVIAPRFVSPNPSDVPEFNTTGDLAQALLRAARLASLGQADVLQVTALCQCTNSIIDLARLQMEIMGPQAKVPWLNDSVTPKPNGAKNGKNGH